MIMCIGGQNDGVLISFLDAFISIPVLEPLPKKLCFDPTPQTSPVIYNAERYRLEKFRFNGESKFVYVFSKLTNEEVLEEINKMASNGFILNCILVVKCSIKKLDEALKHAINNVLSSFFQFVCLCSKTDTFRAGRWGG